MKIISILSSLRNVIIKMLAKTLLRNINGVCQNDPDYITLLNQSLTDELFTKKR